MSADFWAGYVSGAAGIIVGNPLDIIKVRLQAGPTEATTQTRLGWASTNFYVKGQWPRCKTGYHMKIQLC